MPDFLTSDGVRIHHERHGRGPRVYVLHGGPANDFRYMADNLASLEDDFEFVYHDYRGSGRSENADPSTYTVDQLAADLDELRAELGDERITVVAHSMGGFARFLCESTYLPFRDCEPVNLVGRPFRSGTHSVCACLRPP